MMKKMNRRHFIAASAMSAAAVPGVLAAEKKFPKGKAEHCIFIWLGGGACQIDTWDPKRLGDPKTKKAGSAYPAIETAVPGVQVCEHLKGCAKLLDRFVLMRTVNHNVVDEHAAATNRMHTGRPTSGTIVYPSIGSVVAHERGKANAGMPSYVVMGYPNLTRGPGFLGAKHGYIYLTDTKAGPEGLARPRDITSARMSDRERLLEKVRGEFLKRNPRDKAVRSYDVAIDEALALGRGEFKSTFDLKAESAGLRNSYGDEFGQRCLLARRLVQRGVRFIEVSFNLNFINGTGWDTHNQGQENQHILIQRLDAALATLVADLEKNKLLDKTLIVVSTEFGRPAQFDGGGGRGHHPGSFTVALAGGGLKTGQAVGVTDDMGMKIVEQPISVPDLFATIHCALGINPHKNLYAGDRPVPVTDHGQPVREVFA